MKLRFIPLALLFSALNHPLSTCHAQLVADGATNVLNNVTNNITGNVTIGTNGSFTLLVLTNNALLTNSGSASIGLNATAISNQVRVVGPTARWQMGTSLIIGNSGSASRLVISDGALVENFGSSLAFNSGSNNSVLVTDPGTVWSNRGSFTVGQSGRGNQLIVSNGASVFGNSGFLGVVGSANLLLVTGNGSVVTNRGDLEIGYGDASNRLVVADGGQVFCESGRVGTETLIFPKGFYHDIQLTGPGSLWSNRSSVTIRGLSRLVISNGAALMSGGAARLGNISGNNTAIITGAGSQWSSHGDFTLGEDANRLELSGGGMMSASNAVIGLSAFGAGFVNLALLTGAGTVWTNSGNFTLGDNGAANVMTVSNGAALFAGGNGIIGLNSSASGNAATVTDAGSSWQMGKNFYMGSNGPGNLLVVSNGARVIGGMNGIVGANASSSNNTVLVTGVNSSWSNVFNVNIGSFGSGNRLVVENGGRVTNDAAFIGAFGSRNEARLSGTGTLWNSAAELVIGDQGAANLLVMSNGAVALNSYAIIGTFFSASNNSAVVTGVGSTWSNADTLYVGLGGSRNQLVVTNSGTVFIGTNLFLGESPISGSNRITVAGGTLRATNASLTASLDVRRGTNVLNAGLIDVDQLRLTNNQGFFEFNGGALVTRAAVINNGANFVVGGGGSSPATWDVRAGPTNTFVFPNIYVGSNSAFNQIVLTNGARMTNASVVIVGYEAGGNSNLVLHSGAGSIWDNATVMSIGVGGGSGNRLVISDGAVLNSHFDNSIGWIGSSNNEVTITGPASVWGWKDTSGLRIRCGNGGFNNRLVVTNGGLVSSTFCYIGADATQCSNNYAVVTGAGSTLSSLFDLRVGDAGSASQLFVEDNGVVISGQAYYVGFSPSSTNNRVTIDNGSLLVTNATADALLEIRRGTNVLNGGLIEADILRMTNGGASRIELNRGTLAIRSSRVSAGNPVIIGDGSSAATLHLAGNGTHDFTGTLGLIISNNATLMGNGSLLVQLQVRPGATLSPGALIGKISVNTAPFLSGVALMEISRNGSALTNDQFQVTGTLNYGGSLIVSNLGPGILVAGDRFQLFTATSYGGSFTSITLPPLPPPLSWANKLLVDGSIEVIAPPAIAMSSGMYTQSFDSLSPSGGSNPWRDNVTLLGWYAAKTVAPNAITNYIASDGSGNAGALYSFGLIGDSERALGSIGSDSVGHISYGLSFLNDLGVTVSNFVVTFTGEQWRSSSSLNPNTLTFWYRVSPTPLTDPEPGDTANWTQVPGLDFVSPVLLGTGVPLNGNQPANRQTFSSVLISGLAVVPGESVFFRWRDLNDTGTDQGLAVDDLTVTFVPVVRDLGVDVSHFQNESGVPQSSWNQMFAEGKRFVFIKATEGLTGPHDPTMTLNVQRATAAGLLAGVYHFAHPENRPTTAGAVLEASNMVVYAGSAIGPGRLRPVLDLERGANLTTTELTDWVIAFSDEIIARRGPDAAPIIYCSQTFANNELDSRLAGYDLWLRTVGPGADPAVDDPPGVGFADATGVFDNWSFWQYSATGSSGGISPLDLNVCHSEFKPLSSFLIPGPAAIQLTGISAALGGAFEISFTNTPGMQFTMLSSTNVTLPVTDWTVVGPVPEISPGQFQFADTNAPAFPERFYRVRFP